MASGYLERQRRMQDEAIHMAERVTRQYDMDCYRVHMDRELQEIARHNMQVIPFEKRYPELKRFLGLKK